MPRFKNQSMQRAYDAATKAPPRRNWGIAHTSEDMTFPTNGRSAFLAATHSPMPYGLLVATMPGVKFVPSIV